MAGRIVKLGQVKRRAEHPRSVFGSEKKAKRPAFSLKFNLPEAPLEEQLRHDNLRLLHLKAELRTVSPDKEGELTQEMFGVQKNIARLEEKIAKSPAKRLAKSA